MALRQSSRYPYNVPYNPQDWGPVGGESNNDIPRIVPQQSLNGPHSGLLSSSSLNSLTTSSLFFAFGIKILILHIHKYGILFLGQGLT